MNEEHTTSEGFVRQLGLLDSTMLVAGSMIGSGVFIVSGIYWPIGWVGRMVACGVGYNWHAYCRRRAQLW